MIDFDEVPFDVCCGEVTSFSFICASLGCIVLLAVFSYRFSSVKVSSSLINRYQRINILERNVPSRLPQPYLLVFSFQGVELLFESRVDHVDRMSHLVPGLSPERLTRLVQAG